MTNISRNCLAEQLAKQFDISKSKARGFIDSYFKAIADEAEQGNVVYVPNLGKFFYRFKSSRKVNKNINTKAGTKPMESMMLSERSVLICEFSTTVKGTCNAKAA